MTYCSFMLHLQTSQLRFKKKIGGMIRKVAAGYGVVIRLQATNFSSFSCEQKRNVLDGDGLVG